MSGFTPMHVADALFKSMNNGRVMVDDGSFKPRRHLRVYSDGGGWYVRTGKRAAHKNYISAYRLVCDAPFLAVFSVMEDFSVRD